MDCRATESIGGVEHIELLIQALRSQGETDVKVNLDDRPVYSFGYGERQQVLSQVAVGVPLGKGLRGGFQVHALEDPTPILGSIALLRSLGAVVDFSEGVAMFKAVNPRQRVQL